MVAATKYVHIIRVPHALSVSSSELGLPHPLSRKRVCLPPPGTKEGVGYTLACELRESQFGRLVKKLGMHSVYSLIVALLGI
jgi:hypothetical protein